jgi:hypothetical protein
MSTKANILASARDVRFTPESLLWAKSGHLDELTGDEYCRLAAQSGGGSLVILGDYFRRRYFSQMISGTARRSGQRMAPL